MFRIFRNENKTVVKILHMLLQVLALLCSGVGLKAVFRFHNKSGIPNMYSMHSWIGLPTFLMFGLQVSENKLIYSSPSLFNLSLLILMQPHFSIHFFFKYFPFT